MVEIVGLGFKFSCRFFWAWYSQSWYSKATNMRIRNVFLLFMEIRWFLCYKNSPVHADTKKKGMNWVVNGVEVGKDGIMDYELKMGIG